MPRMARVTAVNEPHHVIQRGNRRQNVFFKSEDKQAYLNILSLQSKLFELEIWAYCLMDNHVHLIVVPKEEDSLTKAISETHELYTRMINFREKWRGYLWQGRFKSVPMDERYLYAAVRYVERNLVRAGLVEKAEDYSFSSARAHVYNEDNRVLSRFYLMDEIDNWGEYLKGAEEEEQLNRIRRQSETGRPLGSVEYLKSLEGRLGRTLIKRMTGPRRS